MWTIETVDARFCEACDTLRRLPDPDAKYRAGPRAAWPDVIQASLAMAAVGAAVRRSPPHPGAIDRLYETVEWLAWLTEPQRRITWAIASGISVAKLARTIGCHRNTVANRHAAALLVVAGRLNGAVAFPLQGTNCSSRMRSARA